MANNPTKDLIAFLREESQHQQQRDDMFMALMERIVSQVPAPVPTQPYARNMMHTPQSTPQQARYGMTNQTVHYDIENNMSYQNL